MVQGPRPTTPIFEQPPLLAIEILSPEDRPLRVDRTIAEWLDFGVSYVWVIDPETLESVVHTPRGRVAVADATLRIPGTAIEIPLGQLDEEYCFVRPPSAGSSDAGGAAAGRWGSLGSATVQPRRPIFGRSPAAVYCPIGKQN